MLVTSPYVRTVSILVLAAAAAASLLFRVVVLSQPQNTAPAAPMVSLADHTSGLAAHDRYAYTL